MTPLTTLPHSFRFSLFVLLGLFAVALVTGCASYATPGRAADLRTFGVHPAAARDELSDSSILLETDKRPLAAFPTGIAVARVQAPGYRSHTAEGWGTGRYSIVTT